MSALQQFLLWLSTVANHYQWVTIVGAPTRPATTAGVHVIYAGNFIDAWTMARAFGGYVAQTAGPFVLPSVS